MSRALDSRTAGDLRALADALSDPVWRRVFMIGSVVRREHFYDPRRPDKRLGDYDVVVVPSRWPTRRESSQARNSVAELEAGWGCAANEFHISLSIARFGLRPRPVFRLYEAIPTSVCLKTGEPLSTWTGDIQGSAIDAVDAVEMVMWRLLAMADIVSSWQFRPPKDPIVEVDAYRFAKEILDSTILLALNLPSPPVGIEARVDQFGELRRIVACPSTNTSLDTLGRWLPQLLDTKLGRSPLVLSGEDAWGLYVAYVIVMSKAAQHLLSSRFVDATLRKLSRLRMMARMRSVDVAIPAGVVRSGTLPVFAIDDLLKWHSRVASLEAGTSDLRRLSESWSADLHRVYGISDGR